MLDVEADAEQVHGPRRVHVRPEGDDGGHGHLAARHDAQHMRPDIGHRQVGYRPEVEPQCLVQLGRHRRRLGRRQVEASEQDHTRGDTILEVNVFSPGNLHTCSKLAGVRFSTPILESIERKVEIRKDPSCSLDNLAMAVL